MSWLNRVTHQYPNFYAYTLLVEGREIDNDQKSIFFNRINCLYRKPTLIVYRGESKAKLYETFSADSQDQFNSRFFIIGTKGNSFQVTFPTWEIDETDDSIFRYIFDALSEMFNHWSGSASLKYAIKRFIEKNREFWNYFTNQEKQQDFVSRIRNIDISLDKISIRDYYLTLLHHNGYSGFYKGSFLLSTTTSFSQAGQFAGKYNKPNDKIILMGWVPEWNISERVMSISERGVIKRNFLGTRGREFDYLQGEEIVRKNGLPVANYKLFPIQQEISLKGGLLVHYLVGYLEVDSNQFHINPAFLQENENWVEEGLIVDQSNFNHTLDQTNFKGSFEVSSDGKYKESRKS